MPQRSFDTETWDSDAWFQDLGYKQKLLFLYLWTNDHCKQAGLYHITLTTIIFQTKLPADEVPELLANLKEKVTWYREADLIWVKNFIKRQAYSPLFIKAAAKCLTQINCNGAVKELLKYNLDKYNISIPYREYMDKVSIRYGNTMNTPSGNTVSSPSSSTIPNTINNTKEEGVVKGGKEIAEVLETYKQNIGSVTPVIEGEVGEAVGKYGGDLVDEAIREATRAGKKTWRYINGILENWAERMQEENSPFTRYGGKDALVCRIYRLVKIATKKEPSPSMRWKLPLYPDDKLIRVYEKLIQKGG